MCFETGFWWICPLFFLAVMIFCALAFGRRRRWSCCSRFGGRYSTDEQIRRLEQEIQRLKGEQ